MNKDFAIGYLLGQNNQGEEKPVIPPEPSEIPEEWAPVYERPVAPPIRDDYNFVYILGANLQVAVLNFSVIDCEGIIIDWGDGTKDISIAENGRYYFSKGDMLPAHVYSKPESAIWIKVLIPKQSLCRFRAVSFQVRETIRNCAGLTGIYATKDDYILTICSDTCYCKDDYSYINNVWAVNREVIFLKTDIISERIELIMSGEEIYIKIRGKIPARSFAIKNTGTLLKSLIIEDASEITDFNGATLLFSESTVLSKVIVLNAINAEQISEVVYSQSECFKKLQIISGEKELEAEGIIIECPKLRYISGIINNSALQAIDVNIKSECATNVYLHKLNYGIRNLYISVKSILQPIELSFDSVYENKFVPPVQSIRADIAEPPKDGRIWYSGFFSADNTNNIFSEIKEFSPPCYEPISITLVSYQNFKRALSEGMLSLGPDFQYVGIKLGAAREQGTLSGCRGNTIEDANRIIGVLPDTKKGKIRVYSFMDGTNPPAIKEQLKSLIDKSTAAAKGWEVIV